MLLRDITTLTERDKKNIVAAIRRLSFSTTDAAQAMQNFTDAARFFKAKLDRKSRQESSQ